jgi:hypothetical protein
MTSKFISETVDTPGAHNAWSVALNASLHTIERELRIFSQFHVPRRCVPPVRSIRVAGVAIEPWPRRPGSSRRPRLVHHNLSMSPAPARRPPASPPRRLLPTIQRPRRKRPARARSREHVSKGARRPTAWRAASVRGPGGNRSSPAPAPARKSVLLEPRFELDERNACVCAGSHEVQRSRLHASSQGEMQMGLTGPNETPRCLDPDRLLAKLPLIGMMPLFKRF